MKKSTKKQSRGGARPGAGAPRKKDPLVRFWVSVRASKLKELGGEAKVKASIDAMIEGEGSQNGTTKAIAAQQEAAPKKRQSIAVAPKTGGKVPTPAATPYMQTRLKGKLGLK